MYVYLEGYVCMYVCKQERSKGDQSPVKVLIGTDDLTVADDAVVESLTTVLVVVAIVSFTAAPAEDDDEAVAFLPASRRITAALLGLGTIVAGRVSDLMAFTFVTVVGLPVL